MIVPGVKHGDLTHNDKKHYDDYHVYYYVLRNLFSLCHDEEQIEDYMDRKREDDELLVARGKCRFQAVNGGEQGIND